MTACDEVDSLLALEGADPLAPELLEPEERRTLAEHLAGCAACSARSEAFAGALSALAEPPPAGLPAGFDAVLARLAAGEDPAKADDEAKPAAPGDELPAPVVRLTISLACTYCKDALLRAEATYCASCLAPHHEECVRAHGRCAAPGCEETRVVRPSDAVGPARSRSGAPRRGGRAVLAVATLGGLAAALGVAALRAERVRPPTRTPVAVEAEAAPVESERSQALLLRLLQRAEGVLAVAEGQERAGDLAEAEVALRRAEELEPVDPRVQLLLGRLRLRKGELRSAMAALDRAIALHPDSAEAYLVRARVREAMGDPEGARVDEVRARELGPRGRAVQGEVVRAEGPGRVYVRLTDGRNDVRVGDAFAVRRGGRIAVRLRVVELLAEEDPSEVPALHLPSLAVLARCEAESLVAGAAPEELDVAVLVTDGAVWAEATDRARRAQRLEAIERRREPGELRVLYVEATAGRSWSAARDALLRSRALEARTWLVSDDPTLAQRASAGVAPLTALPATFGEFHVVIVGGDVPPAHLSGEALTRFVRNGGGLVLLPGANGFASLPGALGSNLPVVAGPPDPERPARRVTFGEGLRELPLLLASRTPTLELPQLFGVHTRTTTRRAQLLAQDEQGRPLVALGEVEGGDGRIVQVGADDLWRWETADGGKELLQLFWLEVVAAAAGHADPASRR